MSTESLSTALIVGAMSSFALFKICALNNPKPQPWDEPLNTLDQYFKSGPDVIEDENEVLVGVKQLLVT